MPVRFALVGCGKITERLALPQLQRTPHARVEALIDIHRPAAERLADAFGIDRGVIGTDWRRVLRDPDIDAVAVNVPNHLHSEVAIAALEAKKHVIVEKPIALTLHEADAMIRAAHRHRRLLMVEQTQRFDPVHQAAYRVLRSGRLGAITQVRGRIGHAGPEFWSGRRRSWFLDPRRSGGGVLMDVGIHIVDLLRWLTGKRVGRVLCSAKTLEKRAAVEDNASALLEFTDGTMGSFEVSWTTRPYEVTTACYGARGILRTALGSREPVVVRFCRRRGDPNHPAGADRHPPVASGSREQGAYPYFTACIASGRRPSISGEEGRATLEIVLAAYESLRKRRWVELPLARR